MRARRHRVPEACAVAPALLATPLASAPGVSPFSRPPMDGRTLAAGDMEAFLTDAQLHLARPESRV